MMSNKKKSKKPTNKTKKDENFKRRFKSNCRTFVHGSQSAQEKVSTKVIADIQKYLKLGKGEVLYEVLSEFEDSYIQDILTDIFEYHSETISIENSDDKKAILFAIPYVVNTRNLSMEIDSIAPFKTALRTTEVLSKRDSVYVSNKVLSFEEIPHTFTSRFQLAKELYLESKEEMVINDTKPEEVALNDSTITNIFFVVGVIITDDPLRVANHCFMRIKHSPEVEAELLENLSKPLRVIEGVSNANAICFRGNMSETLYEGLTHFSAIHASHNISEWLNKSGASPNKCRLRFSFTVDNKDCFGVIHEFRDNLGFSDSSFIEIPCMSKKQTIQQSNLFISLIAGRLLNHFGFTPNNVSINRLQREVRLDDFIEENLR